MTSSSALQNRLVLPSAPASETGPVKAWSQPVEMLTYLPEAADVHPMFLDKRVYQGSSGKVYPLPVIDRIASQPVMHAWHAVHIENEFLRLMVMPEIGGRIHVGFDKTNGYDFFYRQNVIKPALVGLAGPWISGGVEFNWPQHHRPNTFMPTDTYIERSEDGSVTVWCSQHDALSHMKGMHGVCLRPGKAVLELKARLYNRTESTQTFLWWANAATRVHEKYQSFFPPDVRYVADHARRAVTTYPRSTAAYYGVDYPGRARDGVPADETPAQFVPDGSYPADDLGWYANIPVPTSYMITSTKADFFGGYDHAAKAGVVHVADHHIAPGKKQWTWGNHDFGYSWDRCLTDQDGPYIELMAGVYTDNQPDFSYLAPGETRTFEQYWYPIRGIGVPQAANLHGALRIDRNEQGVRVGVCVTADVAQASVALSVRGKEVKRWEQAISVASPLVLEYALQSDVALQDVSAAVIVGGAVLLSYAPGKVEAAPSPDVATEPLLPAEIESLDELYLTGVHLRQYRHATRAPELYWREALRRDPMDSRCNVAMGIWHLQRGEFDEAEVRLRVALRRIVARNANPADGEVFYQLGLILRYLGRHSEAFDAFYKATWNAAWRAPAFYALAEEDARKGDWQAVLQHTQKCLEAESLHNHAQALRVVALREAGDAASAEKLLAESISLDPLDHWLNWLLRASAPATGQDRLDLAFDLRRAGLLADARALLELPYAPQPNDGAVPMLAYVLAATLIEMGETDPPTDTAEQARRVDHRYCFPNRLDELVLLQDVVQRGRDTRAAFYLGAFFYDRGRNEDAIAHWEMVPPADAAYSIAQRNLGIAYFNVRGNAGAALEAYDRALEANPASARVLYERDQLCKRVGRSAEDRLAALQRSPDLIAQRDDLSVELAMLLNQTGDPIAALRMLERDFQPWEGGEGLVLAQFVRAHVTLAQEDLDHDLANAALEHLQAALHPPARLGETFHLLANRSELFYWMGRALSALGRNDEAKSYWSLAAEKVSDFQSMAVSEVSNNTVWSARSLEALGRGDEARALYRRIAAHAEKLRGMEAKIDYFATSLPTMLLFHEDLRQRNAAEALQLEEHAFTGLGKAAEAN